MYYRKYYFCNLMICINIVIVIRKKNCYMYFNNIFYIFNIYKSYFLINISLSRIII